MAIKIFYSGKEIGDMMRKQHTTAKKHLKKAHNSRTHYHRLVKG